MELDIYALLKKIRNERGISLREAAKRSGLSHSYIDSLEKGEHPKSKSPIRPSPDILKSLATAYNYDYLELMSAAEYVEDSHEATLSQSQYDRMIKEAEEEYKVNLHDDPDVDEAVREFVRRLAKMKQK